MITTPHSFVWGNLICFLRALSQLILVSAIPQNFIYFSSESWTLITAQTVLCKSLRRLFCLQPAGNSGVPELQQGTTQESFKLASRGRARTGVESNLHKSHVRSKKSKVQPHHSKLVRFCMGSFWVAMGSWSPCIWVSLSKVEQWI